MKKDKIIYWISTGIIAAMMLMSAFMYFTNPQVAEGFQKMGFGDWFRIELGVAKIIAALVLVIPAVTGRVKEWAYAGLGITFISASIAHYSMGDDASKIISPLVFLAVLAVSNIYLHKINKA
jgi:DoxX-like family